VKQLTESVDELLVSLGQTTTGGRGVAEVDSQQVIRDRAIGRLAAWEGHWLADWVRCMGGAVTPPPEAVAESGQGRAAGMACSTPSARAPQRCTPTPVRRARGMTASNPATGYARKVQRLVSGLSR